MNRINLSRLGLFVGASLFPLAAAAQAAPEDPAATASAAAPAAEQDADAGGEGEIIVTALRRDTALQSTPAAVTAISGEEMVSRGIANIESLSAAVPGVSFGKNIGQVHIAVRGIGSDGVVAGQDPRVGFYQDGVYIARPDAQVAGLFDVGSVQVLKGPQGTLYGRNATGGAVVITSARPTDEMDGYLRASYGNYNAVKLEAAASGPVSSTLSARFAVHYDQRDGYGRNIVTGTEIDNQKEIGARASLLWKPSDGLEFLTILDYFHEFDRANSLHYFGAAQPGVTPLGIRLGGVGLFNSRDIASDIDPEVDIMTWGINEQITLERDWGTIKSITSYRKLKSSNRVDVDGTSTQLGFNTLTDNAEQFSQELTANGKAGRLSWLIGGQYFYENIDPAGAQIPLSLAVRGGPLELKDGFRSEGVQKTYGLAGYAQLSYEILNGLTLTAGGRYSTEKKKLDDTFQLDFVNPYEFGGPIIPVPGFPRHLEDRFSRFTPTATLEYQANRDIFLYFTYGQGFKSGGYAFGVNQPAYQPEKITSYEAGIKTTLVDGAVTANLIGFHYDYKDLQVTQVRGTTSVVENAATAKVDGVEFELAVRPVRGMTIGGDLAYVDARYDRFNTSDPSNLAAGVQDLSGNRLAQAPKLAFHLYASHEWRLDDYTISVRGDYNYTGHQYFTPFENRLVDQDHYDVGSASLKLEADAGWSIEGYVRNIGNTKAVAQSYVSSGMFGIPVLGTLIAPRTYGVTLGYSF